METIEPYRSVNQMSEQVGLTRQNGYIPMSNSFWDILCLDRVPPENNLYVDEKVLTFEIPKYQNTKMKPEILHLFHYMIPFLSLQMSIAAQSCDFLFQQFTFETSRHLLPRQLHHSTVQQYEQTVQRLCGELEKLLA